MISNNLRSFLLIVMFCLQTTTLIGVQQERKPELNRDKIQTILARYVKALGGELEISRVKTFQISGSSKQVESEDVFALDNVPTWAAAQWPNVSFEAKFKNDMLLYDFLQEWKSAQTKERLLTGCIDNKKWTLKSKVLAFPSNRRTTPTKTMGQVTEWDLLDLYERNGHPKSALLLQNFSDKTELLPNKKWDLDQRNRQCLGIRFTSKDGSRMDRYFETESGLLVGRRWEQENARGKPLVYEETIEYQQQEKIKTFKRATRKIDGFEWTIYNFNEVRINEEINDSVFDIPAAFSKTQK